MRYNDTIVAKQTSHKQQTEKPELQSLGLSYASGQG